jgi:hypothetical protein
MKLNFTLLMLLLAVATSCKKTSNVDLTLSTSGKLTYKMLDDAGKGLPNVKVSLFDYINDFGNGTILLDTRYTDQNGLVDFGDLNPKTYMVVPDSPMVNKVKYVPKEFIQVITGKTKDKEVKVSDYSGTYNFAVKNSGNSNFPLKNVGILMIPSNKFSYGSSATLYFNVADFKGVSNDLGQASFKVPSNKYYTIFLYNTITNASMGTVNNYTIENNATVNMPLYVYY